MTVAAPGRSKSATLGRVTVCLAMMRCPTTRATRPIGPLIQKMNCQLAQVVTAPPRRTPAATPRLPTAPHRASAVLRWVPAYVVMIRASAEGVSRAALRPWTARAVISWVPLSANPLTSEASVNSPRPVRKTPRRDRRSEMRPPSRRPPPDIIR